MITQPQAPNDKVHACRPRFDRGVAMELAAKEYERVANLFDQLTPEQWAADTDCPDGAHARHHSNGRIAPEMVRQQAASARLAKREGGLMIDALTALQVEKNARLTPAEIPSEVRRLAPRAVRGAAPTTDTHPRPGHEGGDRRLVDLWLPT